MNAGQLHRLARLLREIALTASADPGETPVAPSVIAIIEDISQNDGTSIGEVAQRTGLAQSLVSNTVATLRKNNILITRPDPNDGRRLLIQLDPTVRSGLFESRAARPIEAALRDRLPNVSPDDQKQIITLLEKLASRLTA